MLHSILDSELPLCVVGCLFDTRVDIQVQLARPMTMPQEDDCCCKQDTRSTGEKGRDTVIATRTESLEQTVDNPLALSVLVHDNPSNTRLNLFSVLPVDLLVNVWPLSRVLLGMQVCKASKLELGKIAGIRYRAQCTQGACSDACALPPSATGTGPEQC